MASSEWETVIREKKHSPIIPNNCRALVARRDPNNAPKSPLSYFISITIHTKKSRALGDSLPKLRIKVPKLIGRTIQKSCQSSTGGVDTSRNNNTTKTSNNPRKLFTSKAASLISNVFGSKKSEATFADESEHSDSSSDDNGGNIDNVSRNAEEIRSGRSGDKLLSIFHKLEDDSGSSHTKSMSSINSLNSGELSFFPEPRSPIWDFRNSGGNLENEDQWQSAKTTKETGLNPKNAQQTCAACKLPLKAPNSFLGFLNRSTPLNFIKNKNNINANSDNHLGRDRHSGKKGRKSRNSFRPLARFKINGKVDKKFSMGKQATRVDETDDESEKELCKKKILMGERCRPLNISDSLH
uniref:Uncharacterized protein n=1 Tax=Nelumbo nucifera TaxID=4432 RepID=A0A822YKU2_NELNU|nr:TPA_asm: hypothetical protein HUJ06_012061 [Nelumbo nucifera]